MGLINQENKAVIGLEGIVALFLIVVFIGSLIAFINDYPSFGWFGISTIVVISCAWIWLSGQGNTVTNLLFFAFLLIGIIVFATGVQSDWRKLTEPPKQKQQIKAENFQQSYATLSQIDLTRRT